MSAAEDSEPRPTPALVAVTTDPATTREIADWLSEGLAGESMAIGFGFYAAIAAIARDTSVVVANIGVPTGRDLWRLAELRERADRATIIVVADAAHLPLVCGPLHPDLAATSVAGLPPLRELFLAKSEPLPDQTMRRRSRR
jgi:hypothetical protein